MSRIIDLLPLYECMLQMIGGRVLRGDKSYKVVKFVFTASNIEGRSMGQGSTRSCDSVYTVMNEHNQIVAIHFVRSGDNSEMEDILSRVQQRYEIHGYEDVELFYTDNCCHEYSMLIRAMPSLSRGDVLTAVANSSDLDLFASPCKLQA